MTLCGLQSQALHVRGETMGVAERLPNSLLGAKARQGTIAEDTGAGVAGADVPARTPKLHVLSWPQPPQLRGFARVPTHAVEPLRDQRQFQRATLQLPLRLHSVAGVKEQDPVRLVTRDISSTGVYFLCPREIPVGTAIEIEVVLVERPLGRGNVALTTLAHVRRIESAATPGWHGIAASFDDVEFDRDDIVPRRFLD
jgi:PilZ domain